jgi:hypothetical protein
LPVPTLTDASLAAMVERALFNTSATCLDLYFILFYLMPAAFRRLLCSHGMPFLS